MGQMLNFQSRELGDLFLESYKKGDVKTLLVLLRLYAVEKGLCSSDGCSECPFKGGCHSATGKEKAINYTHQIMENKNPTWGYKFDDSIGY